jgi:hypothetical protein
MSWQKVVVVVVGLPAAALLLFVGWVWVTLSGGLDDVLDLDKPSPTDPEVSAAEDRATATVRSEMVDVRSRVSDVSPGASSVGGGVAPADCVVGQHNVKRDDSFDLSCTLTAVDVVAAPVAGGATDGLRVDAALRQAGWRRTSFAGAGTADLPLRYTRVVEGQAWQLVVDEADLSTMSFEIRMRDLDGLRDDSGRRLSLEDLVARTPRHGDAVVLQLSVEYFRD